MSNIGKFVVDVVNYGTFQPVDHNLATLDTIVAAYCQNCHPEDLSQNLFVQRETVNRVLVNIGFFTMPYMTWTPTHVGHTIRVVVIG